MVPSTFASSTRSRSTLTHFIVPGGSSDTRVTGVNPRDATAWPRRPSTGSDTRLAQREAEELGGVLRGDLPQIGFRRLGEHAVEELARFRPGRLGVREVAAPQHVVDADEVAQLHAEIVLHELHEHVAAPVVAGQQPFLRLPALR